MRLYGQLPDGRWHGDVQRAASQEGETLLAAARRAGRVRDHMGKAVIVDGLLYGSLTAAAEIIGCSRPRLMEALNAGRSEYKGMSARYAEEADLVG